MEKIDNMVKLPYNKRWEIEFFTYSDGKCPVDLFLRELNNKKLISKILMYIDLLEAEGTNLREPHSKYLKDGIFELRINYASVFARILYFYTRDTKIILTNAFFKKVIRHQ